MSTTKDPVTGHDGIELLPVAAALADPTTVFK